VVKFESGQYISVYPAKAPEPAKAAAPSKGKEPAKA